MNNSLKKEFPQLSGHELTRPAGIVLLRYNKISLEKMAVLFELLKNNTTVTTLNLYQCRIGDEHCKLISELLKENTTIKELILGSNPIKEEGTKALAMGLAQNRSVEFFSFNEIESTPNNYLWNTNQKDDVLISDSVKHLGKSLEFNEHLTKLTLDKNVIDDEGCHEICEGLKKNSTLTYLGLSINQIGSAGGKCLANVLSSPTCALEELDISRNPIGEGMNAIFKSLLGNNKLTKLKMYNTGVKPDCIPQLRDLIQKNKTMSEYGFHDAIGADILNLITNTIKENTTIKKLDLDECGLTHISITKLLQALTTNTLVTDFSLCEKFELGYQEIGVLADMIKKNTTLEHLRIFLKMEGDQKHLKDLQKGAKINHSMIEIHLFVSVNGVKQIMDSGFGSMRNYFKRNQILQKSFRIFDKTFVGHRLATEFDPFADTHIEILSESSANC